MPQGSLQEKGQGKSNLKITVFTILAIHVVILGGLLMQGCSRDDGKAKALAAANTNEVTLPPIAPAPGTNDVVGLPAATASNTAPITAVTPTNPVAAPLSPAVQNPEPVQAGTGGTHEYAIKKGDTLAKIAKAHGVSVAAIQKANPGVEPTKLKVDQKIQLPEGSTGGAAVTAAKPVEPGAPAAAATEGGSSKVYVVKSGDTLVRIAKSHGVTVNALKAANSLKTTQIKVNQKLKIPTKAGGAATAEAAPVPAPVEVAPVPAAATVASTNK
jgi:LysM repeat protein